MNHNKFIAIGLILTLVPIITIKHTNNKKLATSSNLEKTAFNQENTTQNATNNSYKELDNCTKIKEPGKYKLTKDLNSESSCISVEANNTLIKGQGHTITQKETPTSGPAGISIGGLNAIHNVTVKDIKIEEFPSGINLFKAPDNTITNNTLINNSVTGIELYKSPNNQVEDNTVKNSSSTGISLVQSQENQIVNNDIRNNNHGIRLDESPQNQIRDNTIKNHKETGIKIVRSSNNNTIKNNNINNSGSYGMNIYNSPNTNLTNNRICNGKRADISLDNQSYPDYISNNTCSFSQGYARKYKQVRICPRRCPDALPPRFDYRDSKNKSWMTSVKNQGSCGSCWAFATIGAVEASYNIRRKNPNLDLDLSEQELVSDCCKDCGDCNGSGSPSKAGGLSYTKKKGVVEEDVFPYLGIDSICYDESLPSKMKESLGILESIWNTIEGALEKSPFPYSGGDSEKDDKTLPFNAKSWNITGYNKEELDGKIIAKKLLKKGPLIASAHDCEHWPDSGHRVVLVGYNKVRENWIFKNSWGEDWGDNGYGRIDFNSCIDRVYSVKAPTPLKTVGSSNQSEENHEAEALD